MVQSLRKTAKAKRFSHVWLRREHADPADFPDIGKPGRHLFEVPGLETVFFFDTLLIKWIESKPIIVCKHLHHLLE